MGTCVGAAESRGLSTAGTAGDAGGGKEEGPELGPGSAAARNSPPGFAGAGVGRGGSQSGCQSVVQAVTPTELTGSGHLASGLVLGSYSLFSQPFITSTASI